MATRSNQLQAVVDSLFQLPEEEQDRYAQAIREIKLAELRQEIRKGIESGPAEPWDPAEFKAKARSRWNMPGQQTE